MKRNATAVWNGTIKDCNGHTEEQFQQIPAGAKAECPVSKAYNLRINLRSESIA